MYAVFVKGSIRYLGNDKDAALTVLGAKSGGHLVKINTLEELKKSFDAHIGSQTKVKPSSLDDVLKRLEDANLANEAEEVFRKTKESGELAIGQVRSLGLRSLKGLGEGFTAIGDILKKASEEDQESKEK